MPAPPLKDGNSIGIVAPASYPEDVERVRTGLEVLRRMGFQLVPEDQAYSPIGYLAGSDESRAQQFNEVARASDVNHIFCLRGGLRLSANSRFD